jgi:hypothetical protein
MGELAMIEEERTPLEDGRNHKVTTSIARISPDRDGTTAP